MVRQKNSNKIIFLLKKTLALPFLMILITPLYSQHEGIRRYFTEYNYNVYPYNTYSYYNDTLLTGFHRFGATKSNLFFTTGEFGAPNLSMIFSERQKHPDFVFFDKKIAIFVDGCFWHGHDCRNTRPADNAEFWQKQK